jgi:hypothetical protein
MKQNLVLLYLNSLQLHTALVHFYVHSEKRVLLRFLHNEIHH